MDVTALSVSVDVDISAFIDAMDRMGAIMLAVADEFDDVAQDIAKSFSGINKEGEKNKSFWDNFKGGFWDFVEAAANVKGMLDLVRFVVNKLGIAFEGVSGVGIAGVFEGIAVAAADLLTPIGWVIDAVAILGVAWYALSGSSSSASNGIQSMSNDMTEFNDKTLVANKNYKDLKDVANGGVSSNAAMMASKSYHFPNSDTVGNTTQITTDTGNIVTPAIKPATEKIGSDNDEAKQQSLFDKFIGRYQDYYEKLKSLSAPAEIKVRSTSSASYGDSKGKSDSKLDIQSIAPPGQQSIPTPQADGLAGNMQLVSVPGIQASAKAVAEYNEGLRESAELQKQLQDVAVGAFSSIGQALGQMIAGQKAINPLAALMKQMGDAFKKYGEFLITAGTAMLFSGDPLGGAKIGEGIALEAVGTAMGAVKLAQGGIVSGSTFANIGEYAGASHNPEVVAPLDKLRGMMSGGGSMPKSVQLYSSFDSLQGVLTRGQNTSGFINGF